MKVVFYQLHFRMDESDSSNSSDTEQKTGRGPYLQYYRDSTKTVPLSTRRDRKRRAEECKKKTFEEAGAFSNINRRLWRTD